MALSLIESPDIGETMGGILIYQIIFLKIVRCWLNGEGLNKTLVQPRMVSFYPPISWHTILVGYGVFPQVNGQLASNKQATKYDLGYIDQFISRCALNYNDHKTFLTDF